MTNRDEYEAAWRRWDRNQNGTLELSEVQTHSIEIASLIGDPAFEDPALLHEFAVAFYDGRGNPSTGLNNAIDKEEMWELLKEAAAYQT